MKQHIITYQENGITKTMMIQSDHINQEQLPLNTISIDVLASKNRPIKRVTQTQLIYLFSELNIMIQANILFSDALEILYQNTQHETLKQLLHTLIKSLENGKSLNTELQAYSKVLDRSIIALLTIAQRHGNLKAVMHSLVQLLQKRQTQKEKIAESLRYPFVLLGSLFALLLFTLYFVVPKFEHLFTQYGDNLPVATMMLLNVKSFLHGFGAFILFFIIALCVGFWYAYAKHKKVAYFTDAFIIKHFKGIRRVLLMMQLQIFFQCIALLLHDKYKFQTAFENSLVLVKNLYLKEKLSQINQQIQSGKSISFAFRNSNLFDELTLRLISVGQKSNALFTTVSEIEKIYQKRLDDSLKKFTHYIEPLFFIIISAVVIWIMMAIFIPIWNLSDALTM